MTFIDANIIMYAAGPKHPHREPCVRALTQIAEKNDPGVFFINSEILQEILHRYWAIGKAEIGKTIFDSVLSLPLTVLPIRLEEMGIARAILEKTPKLSTRDAVHAASMKAHGISEIWSYDRGFDAVPWLERTEPR